LRDFVGNFARVMDNLQKDVAVSRAATYSRTTLGLPRVSSNTGPSYLLQRHQNRQ